ncbi:MAG: GNAT family N-acetyltransferase [Polyangiaceae bacterium]|nr:GNAT family N-acetyltransferase [Polyangiaceae bacterium]
MNDHSPLALEIRPDDLTGTEIRALVAEHLRGMHESSPPESVHALGLEALRAPGLTLYSAWAGPELAGMGALKRLDDQRGEIKSMRVAGPFLGRGVGRAMLHHIVAQAKAMGLRSLWLETGSAPAFAPALGLYERDGFTRCGPFGDYALDPFSIFMTRTL